MATKYTKNSIPRPSISEQNFGIQIYHLAILNTTSSSSMYNFQLSVSGAATGA
jgi:hypothetical protein